VGESNSRGRHTTTSRQLFSLPGGAMMIDTPGLRELQIWDANEGLTHAFADVEELSMLCRFTDCKHEREPGCAVQAAIKEGSLQTSRLESHRKLQRERAFLQRKIDPETTNDAKRRIKTLMKGVRQKYTRRDIVGKE
jgi:ribosome biogenesis GTPase / thiamine phosphate phosphatase